MKRSEPGTAWHVGLTKLPLTYSSCGSRAQGSDVVVAMPYVAIVVFRYCALFTVHSPGRKELRRHRGVRKRIPWAIGQDGARNEGEPAL